MSEQHIILRSNLKDMEVKVNFEEIPFPPALFITGIGTDVGKSFATGWLAREMMRCGLSVITQKMIQTGNEEWSEDIERHRKIMECDLQPVDRIHLTAPVIFSYPASPHLAARLDESFIDFEIISSASKALLSQYDHLLIEGAGGLMVPLREDYLTIDYISDHNLPVVLVVTGQLGSINHLLLSLAAIKTYGLNLFAVIYNPYFDKDAIICNDTRDYLRKYLHSNYPKAEWLEMPVIDR